MPSIVVPQGFSYVLAVATSTFFLNMWQGIRVGAARKAAKIAYPQMYAEVSEAKSNAAANKFNCTQRAHQNTLESYPHVLTGMVIVGLKRPYVAATLGGAWVIGRILYTLGYATGEPAKRMSRGGILQMIATLGMYFTSAYTVYEFVTEGL